MGALPQVWAVIGRKGSGKDTAAEYLAGRLGGTIFSCSGWLRAYADEHGIRDRKLWEVEQDLVAERGGDFLAAAALALPERPVFITGARRLEPLARVHAEGGIVVFVDLDYRLRHARAVARQRSGEVIGEWLPDDQYVAPRVELGGPTWEELRAQADRVVPNGGSLEELHAALDALLAELRGGEPA